MLEFISMCFLSPVKWWTWGDTYLLIIFKLFHCYCFTIWAFNTFGPLDPQGIRQLYLINRIVVNWKGSGVFLSIYFNAWTYLNHRVNQEITFILLFRRVTHCLFPLTSHFLNNCSSMKNLGVIKFLLTYRSRDSTSVRVSCSKHYLYCLFSVNSLVILRCQGFL